MAEFDLKIVLSIIASGLAFVMLIIAKAVSITGSIGQTIISTFNQSGVTIPANMNYLSSVNIILSPAFTIIGIVLLIFAIIWIIIVLIRNLAS